MPTSEIVVYNLSLCKALSHLKFSADRDILPLGLQVALASMCSTHAHILEMTTNLQTHYTCTCGVAHNQSSNAEKSQILRSGLTTSIVDWILALSSWNRTLLGVRWPLRFSPTSRGMRATRSVGGASIEVQCLLAQALATSLSCSTYARTKSMPHSAAARRRFLTDLDR